MGRSLHLFGILAVIFTILAVATAQNAPARHNRPTEPDRAEKAPPAVVRVGAPEKVCQLTGDVDWESGRPTAARTLANFGLDAVDLGYPVEHNGKLIFLFGDSWPPPHGGGAAGEWPPDDSVGVTTRTEPPDAATCLDLIVHSKTEGGKKKFDPATITGPVKVKQGFFNVPSGGVSVEGALYAFFWTDHCSPPAKLEPEPAHPLERPAPTATCPESDNRNSIGRGVMARSDDGGHTFTHVVDLPQGFVYTTAVNAMIAPDLPDDQRMGVFIYGVPRYRASVPYLAYAPPETFADPGAWRYFAGLNENGKPRWVKLAEWKPRPENQIYMPADNSGYKVGEFNVTWNRELHLWLMMYGGVSVRVAREPWGPWSAPTEILSVHDDIGCKLIMTASGCGNRRDFWSARRHGNFFQPGGLYAPYVMNRYTRRGDAPRSATIYWVVSTWNPYEVTVMRTTIALSDQDKDDK